MIYINMKVRKSVYIRR